LTEIGDVFLDFPLKSGEDNGMCGCKLGTNRITHSADDRRLDCGVTSM